MAPAKWAPSLRHSVKLLIAKGEWRSINSDGDARRDNLSL